MKYNLSKLFQDFAVTGISFDSRTIKPGEAFFAIKGEHIDGNKFIDDALKAGAKLIVSDVQEASSNNIFYVDNIRAALAEAASIFYPKLPKHLIAVTGTNGKTSVVCYCQQIFSLLGKHSASIGTLGVNLGNRPLSKLAYCFRDLKETKETRTIAYLNVSEDSSTESTYKSPAEVEFRKRSNDILLSSLPPALDDTSLTTPNPLTLRQIFQTLAENNYNHVAFEASSHGLDQQRLYGIKAAVAAFTSFGQDHLDYHKTMDQYLQAKLKLFVDNLAAEGIAVINSEMPLIDFIKNFLRQHQITIFTVGKQGDLTIINTNQSIYQQKIDFAYLGKNYSFNTKIMGSFQATNLLIAAMLVHKTGFAFEDIINVLPKVKAVQGRLELVTELNHPFHIFVDYSHKPDALEGALNELKKIKHPLGRLIVVFGCGGNRDTTKRPLMGKIAAQLADLVVITDDNPRYEDPAAIRQQILAAAPNSIEIPDREQAIVATVNNLQPHDILLIAGKGNEDYQLIGDKKLPFNDAELVRKTINEQ